MVPCKMMCKSAALSILAFAAVLGAAEEAKAVSLTGSRWLGIDGNWSAIDLQIGKPAQDVSVLVSTTSSEFWVVGPGGCPPKLRTCSKQRGGIFDPSASKDWDSFGDYGLTQNYPGYDVGGEFGRERVSVPASGVTVDQVMLGAMNATNYFNGMIGLGLDSGSYDNEIANSFLRQAADTQRLVPSYTYGFTAGAHYRNSPASLTLGGFDAARFDDNGQSFIVARDDNAKWPRVKLRGLEVSAESSEGSDNQKGTTLALEWDDAITAVIDSNTPYLWLPEKVCESLAKRLDLTYNETFDLYTLSDDLYEKYSTASDLSVVFSMSSIDNSDYLGGPLQVDGVVNITLPVKAFLGQLEYPFKDGKAIPYGAPGVPYFALRQSSDKSLYTIGRSFLQEAYIIFSYDHLSFSLYQARFTGESDVQIVAQPADTFFPFQTKGPEGERLSTPAIVGIVIGAVAALALAVVIWFLWRRRKKAQSEMTLTTVAEFKDNSSSMASSGRKMPLVKIWNIIRKKPSSLATEHETAHKHGPAEAAEGEIYEMPVPMAPVELNGMDHEDDDLSGDTDLGTGNSDQLSSYEQARRKMERQLRGPVPAYTPPQHGLLPPPEKVGIEAPQSLSVPVSPLRSSPGIDNTLPSPITPRFESVHHPAGLVSPVDADSPGFPAFHSGGSQSDQVSSLDASSRGQSAGVDVTSQPDSANGRAVNTSRNIIHGANPSVQREPIDPSRVVFLGALPEDLTFPRRQSLPRVQLTPSPPGTSDAQQEVNTLGSDYTEEQERLAELARQAGIGHSSGPSGTMNSMSRSRSVVEAGHSSRDQGRFNPGEDLVHIPQLAARRYSWEDTL